MSLASSSGLTPAPGLLRVEIKYGFAPNSGFTPFYDNGTNGHQLTALVRFVSLRQARATISVPHVLGGTFVADFELLQDSHVMYYKQDGTPVIFRISSV